MEQRWKFTEPSSELLAQIVDAAARPGLLPLQFGQLWCIGSDDDEDVICDDSNYTNEVDDDNEDNDADDNNADNGSNGVTPTMPVAGVSGEEDQRSGQRTALCHEGPEESYSERWERSQKWS